MKTGHIFKGKGLGKYLGAHGASGCVDIQSLKSTAGTLNLLFVHIGPSTNLLVSVPSILTFFQVHS